MIVFIYSLFKRFTIYVNVNNSCSYKSSHSPTTMYLFKVHNENTRIMCEICSKLKIQTPESGQLCSSGFFIVNFEYISNIVLVFPLLTLNKCGLDRKKRLLIKINRSATFPGIVYNESNAIQLAL